MSADILIVEDSEDIRETLADILRMDGHTVRTAADGMDALQQIDDRFPQLVISDVEMPRLGGQAMVLRMFTENLGRENIPLILMSASPTLPGVAAALGTPYFIQKPFEISDLESCIQVALTEAIPPRPAAALAT